MRPLVMWRRMVISCQRRMRATSATVNRSRDALCSSLLVIALNSFLSENQDILFLHHRQALLPASSLPERKGMHQTLKPFGKVETDLLAEDNGHLRRWHALPILDVVFEDEDQLAAGTQSLVGLLVDSVHRSPIASAPKAADLADARAVMEGQHGRRCSIGGAEKAIPAVMMLRQTREAVGQRFLRVRAGAHLTAIGRRADHRVYLASETPGLHGVGLLNRHLAREQARLFADALSIAPHQVYPMRLQVTGDHVPA